MQEPKTADLLHRYHLKATKPRLKILTYLMHHHNHPTVETIYQALSKQDRQLNKATIYNTLDKLLTTGLVIEIKTGDNSTHYDFFLKPHFHIICTRCGEIADVFYPNFNEIESRMIKEAERQTGYIPSSTRLQIYGLCPDCQKALKKEGQKRRGKLNN